MGVTDGPCGGAGAGGNSVDVENDGVREVDVDDGGGDAEEEEEEEEGITTVGKSNIGYPYRT